MRVLPAIYGKTAKTAPTSRSKELGFPRGRDLGKCSAGPNCGRLESTPVEARFALRLNGRGPLKAGEKSLLPTSTIRGSGVVREDAVRNLKEAASSRFIYAFSGKAPSFAVGNTGGVAFEE